MKRPNRRWLAAGGAAIAVAGLAAAAPAAISAIDQQGPSDATVLAQEGGDIGVERAIEIARAQADGEPGDVELDREGDRFVYEIEVGTSEVEIDAQTGEVIRVEADDNDDFRDDHDDDDDDRDDDADDDDREFSSLPEGAISPAEAIAAAEAHTGGTADGLEVETRNGEPVYAVEVGLTEVIVDPLTGEVIETLSDD